jgi:glucosamine-6-phosphate deaminase
MSSRIDTERLMKYCRIPAAELENHPESRISLKIFDPTEKLYVHAANMMADEVVANNRAGRPTRWVLPAGPNNQYRYFAERVNKVRISLKNLYVFLMDEVLDFNCRPYPVDHPYFSAEGRFKKKFYDPIDPQLTVPLDHRFMPRYNDLETCDRKIAELGGLDTVFGGLGFRGLVAYCEPDYAPWFTVTEEDYSNMLTRIWPINPDTTIASAERSFGGLTHHLPRLGVTIGMKSMLNTRRVVFLCATGAWKRASIRVLMFLEPTVEYPATLFTGKAREVIVLTDPNTAAPPLPPTD